MVSQVQHFQALCYQQIKLTGFAKEWLVPEGNHEDQRLWGSGITLDYPFEVVSLWGSMREAEGGREGSGRVRLAILCY